MAGQYPKASVGDPDPQDPHVFGPPGSGAGSITQRYGPGSGAGSFPFSRKAVERTEIMLAIRRKKKYEEKKIISLHP
jgi:hypothetical protein